MRFTISRKSIHYGLLRKGFYSHIINELLSDCNFILDIGCGLGHFLITAKKKGKTALGVDIDKFAVNQCKTMDLEVVRCDIFSLPIKDYSFDGIFFSHVIEHVPNEYIHKFLTEIRRVLNGKIVVITPTEHSKFWTEGHFCAYSKEELESVLCREGYYVSKVCYDKCFILGIKNHEFLLRFFNSLPFIWLKMNIIAVANRELKKDRIHKLD